MIDPAAVVDQAAGAEKGLVPDDFALLDGTKEAEEAKNEANEVVAEKEAEEVEIEECGSEEDGAAVAATLAGRSSSPDDALLSRLGMVGYWAGAMGGRDPLLGRELCRERPDLRPGPALPARLPPRVCGGTLASGSSFREGSGKVQGKVQGRGGTLAHGSSFSVALGSDHPAGLADRLTTRPALSLQLANAGVATGTGSGTGPIIDPAQHASPAKVSTGLLGRMPPSGQKRKAAGAEEVVEAAAALGDMEEEATLDNMEEAPALEAAAGVDSPLRGVGPSMGFDASMISSMMRVEDWMCLQMSPGSDDELESFEGDGEVRAAS